MKKIFHYIPILARLIAKAFFLWACLLFMVPALAQKKQDTLKHHVVVLIDRSGSVDRKDRSDISKTTAKTMIQNTLKTICFRKNTILPNNRSLLQKGDYVSVLSFGLAKNSPNIDRFIQGIPFQSRKEIKVDSAFNNRIFSNLWRYIDNYGYNRFFDKEWTGLSFAGPLALHSLKSKNNPKDIGRTFIIVVTDGEFNGLGDPNLELKKLESYWDFKKKDVKKRKEILPRYNKIKEAFIWNRVYAYSSNLGRTKNNYKMEVLEYKPLQKTFAIEAVVPLESKLFFNRTPGAIYNKDLQIDAYKNSAFTIERMNLQLKDTINNQLIWEKDFYKLYTPTTLPLEVASKYKDQNLVIESKFWVHFNDGAYGLHTLNPYGDIIQGSNGLKRTYPVVFEKNRRILFGLIPLSDMLYKASSSFLGEEQHPNVIFWNIILLCLFVLIMYLLVRIFIVVK